MPPAAREYLVILFDANTENPNEALQTLIKLNYMKILTPSKDNCKIILTNVDTTSNVKGFENIFALDINEFTPKALRDSISEFSSGVSCWIEAIEVGVEYLKNEYGKPGVKSLQLLFITDLKNTTVNNKECKIPNIINDLNKYGIYLYIVGPAIQPPHPIISITDLQKWMKNLTIDETNENFKLIKKVVDSTTHTVICNSKIGIHVISSFKDFKEPQPWLVPLTFGTKLQLPTRTLRITKEDPPFKLVAVDKVLDMGKWVTADDEESEVDISDCITGVIRHGKFVKIASDGMFKPDGDRCFGVLGFTDSSNIPEYLMCGEATYFVLPDGSKSEQHEEVFSYLIDTLIEQNKYVVARRVYNKNNTPKFVVLIPKRDTNQKYFMMVELPYADDIRFDYVEMNTRNAKLIKVEQTEEVKTFLDGLNIHKENCTIDVPLGPCMMYDPNCINIINKVEETCSKNPVHLANIDIDITRIQLKNNLTNDLRKIWPARETVKVSREETIEEDEFDDYGEIFDF